MTESAETLMVNGDHGSPGRRLPHNQRISGRAALIAVAFLAVGLTPTLAAAREIVTWSTNMPEWNERLGVTLMRQGCSAAPTDCLEWIRAAAKTQQIHRWALAVNREAARWPQEALEYSRLSLSEPLLVEVDIDDFLRAVKSWHTRTPGGANEVLADVARNLKHHNPRLRFGITLYEDELDSRFIALIPAETREKVDRVSLYLHYRANSEHYGRYVADTLRLFPRATIWAGSYAYDRIGYRTCAQSGSRPCGKEEEIALFRDSLRLQLELLQAGSIAGIEFYPGFFGKEEQWHGWNLARICRPERRQDCIENTRRMRGIVAEELERWHQTTDAPADALR